MAAANYKRIDDTPGENLLSEAGIWLRDLLYQNGLLYRVTGGGRQYLTVREIKAALRHYFNYLSYQYLQGRMLDHITDKSHLCRS
eukprot:907665-Pyramimonas_sp.AAC.1